VPRGFSEFFFSFVDFFFYPFLQKVNAIFSSLPLFFFFFSS